MAWRHTSYTGGQHRLIADLLKEGTHRVEAWGNSKEGWYPYLVATGTTVGVEIGPWFSPELGDRLKDLKEAAARTYGIEPKAVKLTANFY